MLSCIICFCYLVKRFNLVDNNMKVKRISVNSLPALHYADSEINDNDEESKSPIVMIENKLYIDHLKTNNIRQGEVSRISQSSLISVCLYDSVTVFYTYLCKIVQY